jgi:spermidine/putrescine transport system ATP-binding protein
MIRPEQLIVSRTANRRPEPNMMQLSGVVLNRIFLGEHTEYLVHHSSLGDLLLLVPRQTEIFEPPFATGESVFVSCNSNSALVIADNRSAIDEAST